MSNAAEQMVGNIFEAMEEVASKTFMIYLERELDFLRDTIHNIHFSENMTPEEKVRYRKVLDVLQERREYWGIK